MSDAREIMIAASDAARSYLLRRADLAAPVNYDDLGTAVALAVVAKMEELSEAMVDAYKGSLKRFISALPEAERATARNKDGGYRLSDERVKARMRFKAMIRALRKEIETLDIWGEGR
jgi:hypothetical protein